VPRLLSLLIAVVVILAGIFTSLPLLRAKANQKHDLLQRQEALAAEQVRYRAINDKITAVKTDPKTVERLAREKFGLGRTGETIFKFRGDLVAPTNNAGSTPLVQRARPVH